jgi:hypothetical protein
MEQQGAAMEAQELQALKYATDTRHKLLAKYLPDLKSIEIDGSLNLTNQEDWLERLQ